jgi:3D (Asp-Asp-Asp) domain-containing protein
MKALALGLLIVTAYHPGEGGGHGIGAMGHEVRPGLTAAVSRDLQHLMGQEIHVNGKWWFVNDLTGPDARRTVDLCVEDEATAREWGRRERIVRVETNQPGR